MIGEIGGSRSSYYYANKSEKAYRGFIAGRTAPLGRRMAGAIVSGGSGATVDKIAAIEHQGLLWPPLRLDC